MPDHGTPARLRPAHGGGAWGPSDPALVHRCARPAQVLRHLPGRAGGGLRRGHALRRLGHRRLQPGPGERRARPPRPQQLRAAALGRLLRHLGPDVLRHHEHRRHPVRGRPPPGAAPEPRQGPRAGLQLLRGPRDGVLLLRRRRPLPRPAAARPGRLLRPDHGRRRLGPAPAHDPHPRGHGHPGGVQPPRGRPEPARDRPPLHRRPRHGRQRDDVPPRRAGGGAGGRRARHVHAEAPRRRAGLRHAHPLLALRGRHQRLLRPGRRAQPVQGRSRVHRRRPHPRPGDRGRHQPVGELLQAARARSRRRSTCRGPATTGRWSSTCRR